MQKQAITSMAGMLANKQCGALTTHVIRWFIKRYNVNMAEASNPDISSYASFNDFFTRPLKNDARPLGSADFISPVDGAISQFGTINRNQIFQAKGHNYTTLALVAGNEPLAKQFDDGSFACLYLSPKDYHRIHMPCDGQLVSMTWHGIVNPPRSKNVRQWQYDDQSISLKQGEEMGRFLLGSTVVMLFEKSALTFNTAWHAAQPIKLGEVMGNKTPN